MQDDHLPVEWFERLDQRMDLLQRAAGIELGVDIRCNACQFDLIERGQTVRLPAAIAQHVCGGHVVRHAIYPGSQRTSFAESREAAPQRDMDLLQQILLQMRVRLVGTRETHERRGELRGDLLEQRLLTGGIRGSGNGERRGDHAWRHIQVVTGSLLSLQIACAKRKIRTMKPYRTWIVAASCAGAALLSTLASGAPQLAPVAKPPVGLQDVAAEVHGRVANDRYQWPGLYFETKFSGRSVYFKTGPGEVILNALVDGHLVGTLTKPASGTYLIDGLKPGSHTVRIEALTESQAGPNEFHGFALPKSDKALPMTPRERQIEFIGDSHTVGYGNTSKTRECTSDEVWGTTDNTQTYGAKIANHYGADYQINAISGRGIVRNYDGSPGDPLPVAYPFALLDHSALYKGDTWHPQIIVIALGTNDFSTPLKAGEKWASRDDLHSDFEAAYVKFIEGLRARNPHAFIIVWATDLAEHEIQQEAGKVVMQLQSKGDARLAFLPIDGLVMNGCDWHPSVPDHQAIADTLIRFIDARKLVGDAR